jgi:hypothetical protein
MGSHVKCREHSERHFECCIRQSLPIRPKPELYIGVAVDEQVKPETIGGTWYPERLSPETLVSEQIVCLRDSALERDGVSCEVP